MPDKTFDKAWRQQYLRDYMRPYMRRYREDKRAKLKKKVCSPPKRPLATARGNVEKVKKWDKKTMAEIFVSFKAEDANELKKLISAYLAAQNLPITNAEREAAGLFEAPSSPEQIKDADELSDEEWDTKYDPGRGNGGEDPEPKAVPELPAKRARTARAPRVSVAPPAAPLSAPAAPPAPPPPPPPDLPPLDTLKAVITSAVRLAQKGEGSKKILDLLPAFKDTTGLTFVMNAEDKHRAALYDLVQAAGLPVV